MTRRLLSALLLSAALLPLLSSCHDDDDVIGPDPSGPWTVTATGGSCVDDEGLVTLTRLAAYERLTVSIEGYDAERDSAVTVAVSTSEADDWLSVTGDTLATDGQIVLASQTNDTGMRRTATLVFTSVSDPSRSGTLTVTQLSASDDDGNGEDARAELFVGYGYDIYAELNNPMSVKTKRPIIDLKTLRSNAKTYELDVIHDCRLSQFNIDVYAATTLQELAYDMTASCSNSAAIDIQGCINTCKQLMDAAPNVSIHEQNVGYGVMTKTVASRTLDRGAMKYLRKLDNESGSKKNLMSLSQEFLTALSKIRNQSGAAREAAVEQVLLDFGTHIVLQADLGGKLDYSFTIDKAASYNAKTDANEEARYTMGQLSKGDRTTGVTEVSSSKNISGAIKIWGGSDQTSKQLKADIAKLDAQGQLPPGHIQEWLASIKYSDQMAMDKKLDVVHFELMPVWDLVPQDLRLDFLEATLRLSSRSDCQLPASILSTDIYEIGPKTAKYRKLFDFSVQLTPKTGSLCRLLYFEKEPVMEVCTEYVPKIRTDQRVTIAYPIYRQHIRMNQGLFLGDGIHQPAYVCFSNGDCYVNPIDTLPAGTVIDKFWYVNGNLLLKNPTRMDGLAGKNLVIQEDYLPLYTDDDGNSIKHRHPLVKVGSKFWTRHDIDHRLLFAEKEDYAGVDYMQNNVCYTQFMWEHNNYEFTAYNGWIWGYSPNTFYPKNPNQKWFLPTPDDIQDLYTYIGFNPKALFKDQLTGWDAEFNGYYGHIDILNRNKQFAGGKRELHYNDQLNCISSKNSTSYGDACLIVLRPDYSIKVINNQTYSALWRNNFYPVRPVRGYMFNYPTIADISKNFTTKPGTYK